MAAQLQKLPDKTQEMLKLAACIGNSFDLTTLAIVSEKSQTDAAADLWKALQEGLILPISETYKFFQSGDAVSTQEISVPYRFLHDRVQQAAYSLIPEDQKQATHYKVGQLLLSNTPIEGPEENLFVIVNQLNQGIGMLVGSVQTNQLAKLNLQAARKAKNSTAYAAAWRYLNVGINLLKSDSWQENYSLFLDFYLEATEAAYLIGDFERVEHFALEVEKNAKTFLDKIKIYEIKITVFIASNQQQEAIDLGVKTLHKLGITLSQVHLSTEIDRAIAVTHSHLTQNVGDIEGLMNRPPMTDPEKIVAVRILSSLVPATFVANPTLFPLIVCEQVNLCILYGNSYLAAFAYANYGLILSGLAPDSNSGYQFGKLAQSILTKFDNRAIQAKVDCTFGFFIIIWRKHLRESLPILRSGYQSGLETGDLEYGSYCLLHTCENSYLLGQELTSLAREMKEARHALCRIKQYNTVNYVEIYRQAVLNLIGDCQNNCQLSGDAYNEYESLNSHQQQNDRYAILNVYLNKMILCFLFEEIQDGVTNARGAEDYLNGVIGTAFVAVFYFYDSLIHLKAALVLADIERDAVFKRVTNNQSKMKVWAARAEMNYLHKYYLVEAELSKILQQKSEAIDLYDKAISLAKQNGYLQEEALSNELAAKFYLDWGKEKVAAGYMQEAYYCYARWGAKAKVVDLETRYRKLLTPIFQRAQMEDISPLTTSVNTLISLQQTVSSSSTTSISNLLDLGTVLKAAQALSSEIHLDKLLATVMQVIVENSGADKAALFLDRDGELEVVIKYLDNGIQCFSPKPVDECKHFPTAVIHYVERTLETVITDAKIHPSIVSDSYFIQHQPQSLLCTPILNQGKLMGVLYLENSLTKGAFTKERVELLKLLCSQAAISLKNAGLYQQSQTYAQQLGLKSQQLEQTLQELQTMQLQLVQNEKMSALGNLVAGVAHEINNPVGFLKGNIQPALDYIKDLFGLIDLYQEKLPLPDAEIEDEIETIDLKFVREDLPKLVGSMQEGVDRIANISTSLRTFSRADSDTPVAFNLHEGIDSTILILKHRLKANENRPEIKVIKNYGQIPQVECFAGQLNQVFMNILANAIDALEESNQGRSFAEIQANPNLITITSECSENKTSVFVRIKDNGRGMPEEVKQKIFAHLFTTKAVGKGTGLGLTIAHQIVTQKHKGLLEVNSTFGQGAEFIIALPAT
ncbi:ATP-binding protein [Microcoleus sp. herbarium19]